MKIYGNLDIGGNLKIRNVILDSVTTEGGFYSGQFGDAAFKTDIPIISGTNFYGMTVKYPDNSVVFRDLDTFTFDSQNFYLNQNPPNTDEAQVNLRDNEYNKIISCTNNYFVNRTTSIVSMGTHAIPANTLKVGSLLKLTYFLLMSNSSGAGRTPTYSVTLNGAVLLDDAGQIINNANKYIEIITVYVAVLSATSSLFAVHANRSNNQVPATAPAVGLGVLSGAALDNRGFFVDPAEALNISVANTVGLSISWNASSTQSANCLFSYAELIP